MEVVHAVLGEVTGDDVGAEFARAAVDRDDVGEDFEEGGLAGAVGADEHDALAALGGEVEIAVNDVVAVGLLDVLEFDDLEAGARRLGELEVDALEFVLRLLDGDFLETLDLFFLGFCARGHRGLRAEAVHEFLEMGDLALLILERGRLLRLAGLFLHVDEIIVVAVVVMEHAAPAARSMPVQRALRNAL